MDIPPADLFGLTRFSFASLLAYIDPGSGSAITPAVIGFLVVIGIALKIYWDKIKSFFIRGSSETEKTDPKSSGSK